MDPLRFDTLVKTVSSSGSRRGMVRLLAALPLGVTLTARLEEAPDVIAKDDDHGSSHRRQRRKARHKHDPGKDKNKKRGKGRRKGKGKESKTCAKGCSACQTCNPATGLCENVANGTSCSDGEICTEGDTCQNGVCQGTPVTCTVPDSCCPSGTPNAGACGRGAGECTADSECCSDNCFGGFVCCPVCPPDCACNIDGVLGIIALCMGSGGSGEPCDFFNPCELEGEACFDPGVCRPVCPSVA